MIGFTYKCCSDPPGLGLSKTRVIGRERGLPVLVYPEGNLVRWIKYRTVLITVSCSSVKK